MSVSVPKSTLKPLPETMQCIEITEAGGPEVLSLATRALPTPGASEVLIRVIAAGINRPDVFQRQGGYPPPEGASDLPGLEVAGEIVALGNKDGPWQVGDRVCALLAGGGYAEYAIAHQDLCLPIPDPLSATEAAALPETFFTVWHNVFERGRLKAGEVLLVHGGASGIGTTAIQLAKALGARVFTTVGNDEKVRVCEKLGAEKAFNYHHHDFVEGIKTTCKGANVILDMVGGDYVKRNIRAAAFRGRIVSIAFLRGSKIEIDLMPVMLKQLVLTGSTLRSQPVADKTRIANGLRKQIWPLLAKGQVKPQIHTVLPLADAAKAHQLMESNTHIGKIILRVSDE